MSRRRLCPRIADFGLLESLIELDSARSRSPDRPSGCDDRLRRRSSEAIFDWLAKVAKGHADQRQQPEHGEDQDEDHALAFPRPVESSCVHGPGSLFLGSIRPGPRWRAGEAVCVRMIRRGICRNGSQSLSEKSVKFNPSADGQGLDVPSLGVVEADLDLDPPQRHRIGGGIRRTIERPRAMTGGTLVSPGTKPPCGPQNG